MKSIAIKASKRENSGKKGSTDLRRAGMVPGILYGGAEQTLVKIDERQFKNLVYTPNVYLVDLDIDGQVTKAVLQDIQFHPVTDRVMHADFLLVTDDKPVVIAIPVITEGASVGVVAGGKLTVNRRRLKVKGLASALVDTISIDISDLKIGDSVKINEIKINGLEILDPASDVILSVKATRAARGGDEEEEEAVAEGETAEAEA
jgi:large subunit ribosomal protein L25